MALTDIEAAIASFTNRGDIVRLVPPGGIGIELGVAEGRNSERLLAASNLAHLVSVDAWADHHDTEEYWRAVRRLAPYRARSTVLRMRFDEAVRLFDDNYFDLIYVDGYAHTGEEGGQTFRDWWPKCKPGGIFGGDDYHPHWPLVIQEVQRFVAEYDLRLHVISCARLDDWASQYPTWFVVKP